MYAVEEMCVHTPPCLGGVTLLAPITGLEENFDFCCLKYFPLWNGVQQTLLRSLTLYTFELYVACCSPAFMGLEKLRTAGFSVWGHRM